MYKKILVAYDGSEFSEVALNQGAGLAELCNAELHLVGILATSTQMIPQPGLGTVDIWGMERDQIETALEAAAKRLSGQGLRVTKSIRDGNPAAQIAGCAHEWNANLVIVGHSDKGVLARWFAGSVGSGLLSDLPCNMLVATSQT